MASLRLTLQSTGPSDPVDEYQRARAPDVPVGVRSAMSVAPQVLWLSALNATVCTFMPVLTVMMAIERIGAPMTTQIGMFGPLSTILMGVLILGEPFTAWIAAGTVLVMTGIWLLAKWR